MLEFLFMSVLLLFCKITELFEKKTEVTTSNGKKLKYIPTKCAKLFEECLQRNNDRVFYVVNSFTNKEVLVQNVDIYMPEPDGTLKESAILLEDYLMPVFEAEDHFVQMNIFKKKGKVRIVGMDMLFLEEAIQRVYGKPVKFVEIDDPDFLNGSNEDLIIQDEITEEPLGLNRKTPPKEYKQQNQTKQKIKSKLSNKKINLQNCNKEDLLTINGFDSAKAEKFIKDRANGKVYYDLETFVEAFGLQPHQMIEVQDRIIFPPKPINKIGRKIDW